jgi:hypothetical protein
MCFVSISENRRMKSVEIIVRRGGEGKRNNNGSSKSNDGIF